MKKDNGFEKLDEIIHKNNNTESKRDDAKGKISFAMLNSLLIKLNLKVEVEEVKDSDVIKIKIVDQKND